MPAEYALEPKAFGRRAVQWRDVEGTIEEGRLEAAKLQHHAAIAVRVRLRGRRQKQREFAEDLGLGPERLSRMLNGASPIALDDLMVILEGAAVPFARVVREAFSPDEGDASNLAYLRSYLERQLAAVTGRISDSGRGRPST